MFIIPSIICCIVLIFTIRFSFNTLKIYEEKVDNDVVNVSFSEKHLKVNLTIEIFHTSLIILIFIYFELYSFWYLLFQISICIIVLIRIIKIIFSIGNNNLIQIHLKNESVVLNDHEISIKELHKVILEKRIGQSSDDSDLYNFELISDKDNSLVITKCKSMKEMIELYKIISKYINIEGEILINRGLIESKCFTISEYERKMTENKKIEE